MWERWKKGVAQVTLRGGTVKVARITECHKVLEPP